MDLVDIPRFDTISKYDLESSTILARKVYEKSDVMVRKFVLWKTNKSENRKDPIKREMKITNSEEQAWDLLNANIEKEMLGTSGGLKRGWNEYSIMDLSLL